MNRWTLADTAVTTAVTILLYVPALFLTQFIPLLSIMGTLACALVLAFAGGMLARHILIRQHKSQLLNS